MMLLAKRVRNQSNKTTTHCCPAPVDQIQDHLVDLVSRTLYAATSELVDEESSVD